MNKHEELFEKWKSLTTSLTTLRGVVQNPMPYTFEILHEWMALHKELELRFNEITIETIQYIKDQIRKGNDGFQEFQE